MKKPGRTQSSQKRSRQVLAKSAKAELAVQTQRAMNRALSAVIRASARDRWSAATVRNLNPDKIEQILRSALVSGSFTGQWELFDLMEDTWPRLKKNLNELKGLGEAAHLVPVAYVGDGKKPSATAERKKDFLAAAVAYSKPDPALEEAGWSSGIYDLCDGIGKGISVMEILWETRVLTGAKVSGPAIMPRAFQWIWPRHYGYWIDEPQLKLSVTGMGGDWQDFPPDKFIIAKYKTKTGHTLTAALLRSLATIWIGANFSYDWALNLAQMFGLPIRWATYDPSNPQLLDEICEMLENMGSAGWGAFPAGTTFELKEALKDAAHNPQHFLMELADRSADILILGQTLTTEQGQRGSQALGKVHMDVRADIVKRVANWISRTLTEQFVGPLMRLNFGNNDEDPKLAVEIEGAEQNDELQMAQRDKILIGDLQIPVSRPWLYDRYDIPMPEDGDDIFIAPQPKAPAGPGAGADESTAARLIQAKSANERLLDHVLEDVTGVASEFLGPVKPFFARLIEYAKNDNVTDAELLNTIEEAATVMPELAPQLNKEAVSAALERAMVPGLINGVSRAVRDRKKAA